MSEKEKTERWEKFQERVFSFVHPSDAKSSSTESSRKEASIKPDTTSPESTSGQKSPRQPEPVTRKSSEKTSSPTEIKSSPQMRMSDHEFRARLVLDHGGIIS